MAKLKTRAYVKFFSGQIMLICAIVLLIFAVAALMQMILFGGFFNFQVKAGGSPLSHPFTILVAIIALLISFIVRWVKKTKEQRLIESLSRHKRKATLSGKN